MRMLVESRTNAIALLFVLVPGSTVTVCPSEQLSTMSGNTLWLGSAEATPVKHIAAAETARRMNARVISPSLFDTPNLADVHPRVNLSLLHGDSKAEPTPAPPTVRRR
jgi:hypothetical protein